LAVIFGEDLFWRQREIVFGQFFRPLQTVFVSYGHVGMVAYH